ncbi:msr9043 (plasmid) [Mesorhizobium japonicum MAFF 303099]|uniref:Msr9043 protein n=1 Tax=Mesorhizobium japonicum (strain LMG 29417 / CECT 9101 / MAFF 303099) TaxID=266835 RepID=Q982J0_RHILO|nr:msr9043 [Mesorhizobium japonicum MAFF 303099]
MRCTRRLAWTITAHSDERRLFRDGRPGQALRFFEQLYRVERQAPERNPRRRGNARSQHRRFRQQHGVPILNALKVWLGDIVASVLPDSKLGNAVSYT